MPLLTDDYKAPWWGISGHASSLVPYFTRRPEAPYYKRNRLETDDEDFIDLDTLQNNHPRVVLLVHGLEGSSHSQYIRSAANLLQHNEYDVAAINHRSCSGTINKQLVMYHSGFTEDLAMVVKHLAENYTEIFLMGFSLGGNMICRYLSDGTHSIPSAVRAAAVVSVPTDLADSARALAHWTNKIYGVGFLRTLKSKAYLKAEQFPGIVDKDLIDRTTTLVDFDHHFTAPIHGFNDAWDYYRSCSSKPYLSATRRPLLMINALDDPFLGRACYPTEMATSTSDFYLTVTRRGGHVGFMQSDSPWTFCEAKAMEFFEGLD